MIITLSSGRRIDPERELNAEERHIVQKLYAWADVIDSISAFREKRKQAIDAGWNGSGPVAQRDLMARILDDLEKTVEHRLQTSGEPGS